MILTATESKSTFTQHPEGIYRAKLVEVITHNKKTGEPFKLKDMNGNDKERLALVFQSEAETEREGGTENCTIWDWHNIPSNITNEAGNLHKRLVGLGVKIDGDFDTDDLLGLDCKITVDYDSEKDKSKILSAKPLKESEAWEGADYEPYNDSN
jgi:hypothetical protein